MTQVLDPYIGVSFELQYTGTTTDGEDAPFALGMKARGADGTEWVFVQAGAAITQYDTVIVDENYQAQAITTTLATEASGDSGCLIAFAQLGFSDNQMGWVATKGSNISARGAAATTADVLLYTTATAGVLSSTSAGVLLNGVTFVAAASASSAEIIASNPVSRALAALAS